MNDLIAQMDKVDSFMSGLVQLIMFVTLYVFAKTVLWWVLFGTGKLILRKITPKEWLRKTLIGSSIGLSLIVLNAILIWSFSPDSTLYKILIIVCLILATRIIWREFFTLGGLLRGDWNPFCPELRFFAWDTFNVWAIFKPLKWWWNLRRTDSNLTKKETAWGSYSDMYEMGIYGQKIGYCD